MCPLSMLYLPVLLCNVPELPVCLLLVNKKLMSLSNMGLPMSFGSTKVDNNADDDITSPINSELAAMGLPSGFGVLPPGADKAGAKGRPPRGGRGGRDGE